MQNSYSILYTLCIQPLESFRNPGQHYLTWSHKQCDIFSMLLNRRRRGGGKWEQSTLFSNLQPTQIYVLNTQEELTCIMVIEWNPYWGPSLRIRHAVKCVNICKASHKATWGFPCTLNDDNPNWQVNMISVYHWERQVLICQIWFCVFLLMVSGSLKGKVQDFFYLCTHTILIGTNNVTHNSCASNRQSWYY